MRRTDEGAPKWALCALRCEIEVTACVGVCERSGHGEEWGEKRVVVEVGKVGVNRYRRVEKRKEMSRVCVRRHGRWNSVNRWSEVRSSRDGERERPSATHLQSPETP